MKRVEHRIIRKYKCSAEIYESFWKALNVFESSNMIKDSNKDRSQRFCM